MKSKLKSFLKIFGLAVIRDHTLKRLVNSEREFQRQSNFPEFLSKVHTEHQQEAISLLENSKGEIFQDIFAALLIKKNTGFFVEFGATNGVNGSNTWLLENTLNWQGILSEPAKIWHQDLKNNRNCHISTDCVWRKSGEIIQFSEAIDAGFSTISSFTEVDRHAKNRKKSRKYEVKTTSLDDLLEKNCKSKHVDYLSIDTEGSEFQILSNFSFKNWAISVITIEHNYRPDRDHIHKLLNENGFTRVLTSISKFDDWYINNDILDCAKSIFVDLEHEGEQSDY